jgi:hypothetical protein
VEITEYWIWKLVALAVVAFVYEFWRGFTGR